VQLRSFIHIALIAAIAMAIGGAVAYGTPIMAIAGVILFLIAAASFAYGENREMIYPSDAKPKAVATPIPTASAVEPAIAMTPTMAFLPTNVPAMPSPMMVETNTPVRLEGHAAN